MEAAKKRDDRGAAVCPELSNHGQIRAVSRLIHSFDFVFGILNIDTMSNILIQSDGQPFF